MLHSWGFIADTDEEAINKYFHQQNSSRCNIKKIDRFGDRTFEQYLNRCGEGSMLVGEDPETVT